MPYLQINIPLDYCPTVLCSDTHASHNIHGLILCTFKCSSMFAAWPAMISQVDYKKNSDQIVTYLNKCVMFYKVILEPILHMLLQL